MTKQRWDLHRWAQLALLVALMLVLDLTGLAMIPLPGQYASVMTVPVAVGAMLLGPAAGGLLGGVMGLVSFFTAMKRGFDTLFLAGYTGGSVVVLAAAYTVVPRVLMGLATGWLYRLLRRWDKRGTASFYLGGLAAPLLNTVLFMSALIGIFLGAPTLENLLGQELLETFRSNIVLFAAAYVGVQALIEAAIGCAISGTVCKVLRSVQKR